MQENEKHLAYDPKYGVKSYWQLESKLPGKDWDIWLCPFHTKEAAENYIDFIKPKVKQGVELRITEKHEPKQEYQRTCTPEWYENGFEIIKSYVKKHSNVKGIPLSKVVDFARKEADAKILLEKVKGFYANEKYEPNDANLERMYCDENGLYFFEIVEVNRNFSRNQLRDILNGLNDPAVESEVLAYIVRLQNTIDELNQYVDDLEDEQEDLEETIDEYENDDVVVKLQAQHEKEKAILQEKNYKLEKELEEKNNYIDALNKDENELTVKLQAELQRKEQIAKDALNTAEQSIKVSEQQAASIIELKKQVDNGLHIITRQQTLLNEAQNTINQQQFVLDSIKANQPIQKADESKKEEVAAELEAHKATKEAHDQSMQFIKKTFTEMDTLRSKLGNAENEIKRITINLQNAEAKYKLTVENSQAVIDELKEKLRYTEQESQTYADRAQQFSEARQSDLLTQFATLSAKHKIDENQLYVWTVINTGDNGVYWRYVIGKQSDFKEMAKVADGSSCPIFVPALVNFFLCDGNRGGWSTIKYAKPEYAEKNQRWQCIFI